MCKISKTQNKEYHWELQIQRLQKAIKKMVQNKVFINKSKSN